jgi:hypothetical protein
MRFVALWLLTCALAILGLRASPASAAQYFPVVGEGYSVPEVGLRADHVDITETPIRLAAASDGTVAFSTAGRIYWLRSGRIARVSRQTSARDMVFAADGSLLVASGDVVWRYGPSGGRARVAGQPGKKRFGGDGGPAVAARFGCAWGLDIDSAGGILVADACARRVRRISPDGLITTIAGTGSRGRNGDDGPAIEAALRQPDDVVALPGGGFAILDGRSRWWQADLIRRVDADGRIHAWTTFPVSEAIADPDGSLLMVNGSQDTSTLVRRLRTDGTIEPALDERDTANVGIYKFCIGLCGPDVGSIARTADGGYLIALDFSVQYIPPEPPAPAGMLEVGIAPATRMPRSNLEVVVRLTRPAAVHVDVSSDGRRRDVELPPGVSVLPFPELTRPAIYDIEVEADDGQQTVAASAQALAGGITTAFARSSIVWSTLPYGLRGDKLSCRRSGWRADCGVVRRHRCVAVVRVEINDAGAIKHSTYSGGPARRCRIRLNDSSPAPPTRTSPLPPTSRFGRLRG